MTSIRKIKQFKRFRKDYRRELSGQYSKQLSVIFPQVIELLVRDVKLPRRFFDHPLSGNWNDHSDCHIRLDLILIYRKPDDVFLELVRLGSHSELGL